MSEPDLPWSPELARSSVKSVRLLGVSLSVQDLILMTMLRIVLFRPVYAITCSIH